MLANNSLVTNLRSSAFARQSAHLDKEFKRCRSKSPKVILQILHNVHIRVFKGKNSPRSVLNKALAIS